MTHPIYIAEFDEDFMIPYRQFCGTSPVDILAEPKIFLHDPAKPCKNQTFIAAASLGEKLPVKILEFGRPFNELLEMTQFVVALSTTVDQDGFIPYAALMGDPNQSRLAGSYSRALTSALLDLPNGFHIKPFVAPLAITKELLASYSALSLDEY